MKRSREGFGLKTVDLRPVKSETKFSLHLISGSSLLTPQDCCAQLWLWLCTAQVGSAEEMMVLKCIPVIAQQASPVVSLSKGNFFQNYLCDVCVAVD